MTTHYQKIQALGERMASNLETMGVSASFSDGGLTLADKILQIQRFNSGLMVYADKDIAQSGNTVNISALLMKNGKAVSGERVILKGLNSEVTVGSADVSINTDYMITLNTEATFSIRDSNNGYVIFMYYINSWQIKIGSGSFTPIGDGVVFIESGAVKYYDSNNVLQTVSDFTGAVMNSSNGANNTAYPIWVGTTGSDGVVSKSYTCSGAGLLNITAESGTLVSETYSVIDASFIDTGLSDSTANVVLSRMSREKTSNGAVITATGNNAWAIMKQNSQVFSNNCIIEFDLIANETPSTSVGIDLSTQGDAYQNKIYFEDLGHYKIQVTPTGITALTGSNPIGLQKAEYPPSDVRISFYLGLTGDTITYKDFVIYPI